jgi:hypothetical protein
MGTYPPPPIGGGGLFHMRSFRMICGKVKSIYVGKMECIATVAISGIYGVSVSICFVSVGQNTHPPTVIVREVVTERKSGQVPL